MSGKAAVKIKESDLKALKRAFESGDQAAILESLGTVAREKGMSALANETGGARKALYDALSATGNPRFNTLLSVLEALGLKLQVAPAADSKTIADQRIAP